MINRRVNEDHENEQYPQQNKTKKLSTINVREPSKSNMVILINEKIVKENFLSMEKEKKNGKSTITRAKE